LNDSEIPLKEKTACLLITLTRERETWRWQMEQGKWAEPDIMTEYRKHRNTGLWRSTRVVESLMEYILFLESKL